MLLSSNSSRSSYLIDTEGFDEINRADTGVKLARPNRGLRLWLPLQLHGIARFSATLQEKLLLSDYFYGHIAKIGFETGLYPDVTVTLFRYPEDCNAINQQPIDAIYKDGRDFFSTVINGNDGCVAQLLGIDTPGRN